MNDSVFLKLKNADKIIIGLSGGADSIALTHILFTVFGADKLVCVHVNHQIRGQEAMRDENFVLDFCKNLNLNIEVFQKDIPKLCKQSGESSEECGRRIRYESFQSLATKNSIIATAHNADDNAETVILNLIRGTGLKGVCGIPNIRGNIVRPILDMSREQIEKYCKNENLQYITDSTNLGNDYSRNKIRNQVLPILKQINEKATENINRSSNNFKESFCFVSSHAENVLKSAKCEYGIRVEILKIQSDYIIKQIIYTFLVGENIYSAEERHINEILKIIKNNFGAVILPGEIKVELSQGILLIEKKKKLEKIKLELNKKYIYAEKEIFLAKKTDTSSKINNLLFKNLVDCDKIINDLSISKREDGEKFAVAGRGMTKSLKKLFNEAKIPKNVRDEIIIIRDGKEIVYIEGFGVSEIYKVTSQSKNVLEVNIMKREDKYERNRYD